MVTSEHNRRYQEPYQTPQQRRVSQQPIHELRLRVLIKFIPQRTHRVSISRERPCIEGNINCDEKGIGECRYGHREHIEQHYIGPSVLGIIERLTPREALSGLMVKRLSLSITNLNWMNWSTGATSVMKGYMSMAIQSNIWKKRVRTTS